LAGSSLVVEEEEARRAKTGKGEEKEEIEFQKRNEEK